jgi:hypothetical protein
MWNLDLKKQIHMKAGEGGQEVWEGERVRAYGEVNMIQV